MTAKIIEFPRAAQHPDVWMRTNKYIEAREAPPPTDVFAAIEALGVLVLAFGALAMLTICAVWVMP